MILLGIETSGDTAGVALCEDGRPIASRTFPARMALCRELASVVEDVLASVPEDRSLGGIAVSLGPGSFTSLRIGVVTAKAMAHRLELPLVGVPTPEALAAPYAHDTGRTVCVVQPAWRTALYLTVCDQGRAWTPVALEPDEVSARLQATGGPLLLVGAGALQHRAALAETLGQRALFAPAAMGGPSASLVAQAAMSRVETAGVRSAFEVRPLYVVPSQAERVAGIDLGLTGAEDHT